MGTRVSELMQHYKENDFYDENFPRSSERIKFLKHDKGQVERMCKKIQEAAILDVVEMLIEMNIPEQEIMQKIIAKYSLTETEAQSYIEKCALQIV